MILELWRWLNDNGTALGVILAFIPIVWGGVQYILIKRAEEQRVRFTTFHNLIKQLVEPENPNGRLLVDRQIAIIYELRNFEDYFPVTLRILNGLKVDWVTFGSPAVRERLFAEIDLTIEHIRRKI